MSKKSKLEPGLEAAMTAEELAAHKAVFGEGFRMCPKTGRVEETGVGGIAHRPSGSPSSHVANKRVFGEYYRTDSSGRPIEDGHDNTRRQGPAGDEATRKLVFGADYKADDYGTPIESGVGSPGHNHKTPLT